MQTIYRKRVRDSRYGVSVGECYRGVHLGRHSLYIKRPASRTNGLLRLRDYQGRVEVN